MYRLRLWGGGFEARVVIGFVGVGIRVPQRVAAAEVGEKVRWRSGTLECLECLALRRLGRAAAGEAGPLR